MPQTQELPQVYPEHIPLVSMFQGYNPETMGQVEGPYRGGWVPFNQDPVAQLALAGGSAGLSLPRMFANLAYQDLPQMVPSRGMPSGSVMEGWQKIPNTTEPDIEGGQPTEFLGKETNWQGRSGTSYGPPRIRKFRGGPGSNARTDTIVDPRFRGTERLSKADMQNLQKAPLRGFYGSMRDYPNPKDAFGRPVTESDLRDMTRRWLNEQRRVDDIVGQFRKSSDRMFGSPDPTGLGKRIPVQITPSDVPMAMRLYGTPARQTAPLPTTITPSGQAWFGAAPTTELPSIADLFRGLPE